MKHRKVGRPVPKYDMITAMIMISVKHEELGAKQSISPPPI